MSFSGKTVIVTGATSGIGRAAAEAFGRDGACVVLVGRNERALSEVAGAISTSGGQAVTCRADVTSDEAPAAIVAAALAAFGHIDVIVNAVNPGVTVTNLHRRSGMDDAQYAAFLERSKTTHPLGRPGQPDDIVGMILFLASDRASWMTGETIPIDGGRHLTCAR